jgi:hypothetical protein
MIEYMSAIVSNDQANDSFDAFEAAVRLEQSPDTTEPKKIVRRPVGRPKIHLTDEEKLEKAKRQKERQREYHKTHQTYQRDYQREYQRKNAERIKEYRQEFYADYMKEYQRKYLEEHAEENRRRAREYYHAHKEEVIEKRKMKASVKE